jgi:hypothetical protein
VDKLASIVRHPTETLLFKKFLDPIHCIFRLHLEISCQVLKLNHFPDLDILNKPLKSLFMAYTVLFLLSLFLHHELFCPFLHFLLFFPYSLLFFILSERLFLLGS